MQVDLKKLKPLGIVLILGCAVLAFIMCLTVDMGIPAKYDSLHNLEYYRESPEHLDELIEELVKNEFPNLPGIGEYYADAETMTVVVYSDRKNADKVRAVLERDFGRGLFNVITEE